MARHVRAACCAAPGQGLEPQSRRSERRILPIKRTRIAVRRRTARGSRTLITAGLSRGPLPVGLERRGHHEDSNPVLLVTKEVFYLSNSGGERYGENAVPVRTVGIEPTTPGWKPGVFPLHH